MRNMQRGVHKDWNWEPLVDDMDFSQFQGIHTVGLPSDETYKTMCLIPSLEGVFYEFTSKPFPHDPQSYINNLIWIQAYFVYLNIQ